ncbi:aldehyde dehydrogenase family protein [Streptomyces sp. URMC 123]|uniref:aldehyde dehydrogenase family protein n=1 Tax=Streptomyces sp. URMC 123 TaxID=3423403 RepID=UPI003F1B3FBC
MPGPPPAPCGGHGEFDRSLRRALELDLITSDGDASGGAAIGGTGTDGFGTGGIAADGLGAGGRRHFPVPSAFTGERVARVPLSTAQDVHRAVRRARQATVTPAGAFRLALTLRSLLRADDRALRTALVHASGLGPRDAEAELGAADDVLRGYVTAARRHHRPATRLPRPAAWPWRAAGPRPGDGAGVPGARGGPRAPRCPDTADALVPPDGEDASDATDDVAAPDRTDAAGAPARPGAGATGGGHRAPVVAAALDPARPVASLLEGALPALLNGSPVITRADPRSTVVAALVILLAHAAGLPRGGWQLLVPEPGRAPALRALLAEHTDLLAPQCCGTSAPSAADGSRLPLARGLFVVRHDARVPAAARAAAHACFSRAGRSCCATPVVAVHIRHWSDFLRHLVESAERLSEATQRPSVLFAAQQEALARWLDSAVADGVRLLYRGPARSAAPRAAAPRPGPGPYVLTEPCPDRVRADAVPVGPVALVTPYVAWAEVLHLAERTGRHTCVFTRTRPSRLLPQLSPLPATDLRFNTAPRAGLPPLMALRALADGAHPR